MNLADSELKKLAASFYDMKKNAADFFKSINQVIFNARPSNGKWSVAECIDHLIVTGNDYCNLFEVGLKDIIEKNVKQQSDFKYSWLAIRFINFVEPPVRFKVKAPKKWKPDSKINFKNASEAFLQLQDRFIDLINASNGWDITKFKLHSPASKLIKFSGLEILSINAAHQRRHFEQAKNTFNIVINNK
jgi:hypothetical protein